MIFPVYRRSEPDTLEPRTPSRSSLSTLPRSTLLQRNVAEQLRVGTTSIRNWERNLSQPSVAYMPGDHQVPGLQSAFAFGSVVRRLVHGRRVLGLSQRAA